MDIKVLTNLVKDGIMTPEEVWRDFLKKGIVIKDLLQQYIIPIIVTVTVISTVLNMIFGYPMMGGRFHPSIFRAVWMIIGGIVTYLASLYIFGWISAFLAEKFGGKNDLNRAVLMLFLISLPSFAGQILGTLPIIGFILSIGLSIYSLVLLYKAFPLFLDVPLNNQSKCFIIFILISVVVGMILGMITGAIFSPPMR